MLRGVIVDDEKSAIDVLKNLLENSQKIHIIKTFNKSSDAIKEIPKLKFDVAFLDIDMPGINGIELARNINELNNNIEIVFVTEYDEYAIDAFRVNAIDYLLKPMLSNHINETIDRLLKRHNVTVANKNELIDYIPKICCFGAFEVYGDSSEDPIRWRTSKSKEIFAYLFQNKGIHVPKWKICEVIWPELPRNKVDVQLHTAIYKIKKTLISANIEVQINFINGNYIMKLPQIYSDIDEFDEIINSKIKITEENINRYEEALAIYRNNYLEENEYMWAIFVKDDYIQKFTKVAKNIIDFYIIKGDYNKAIAISRRVLNILPLDEKFHEILLELYIKKRDRVYFFKHYNLLLKIFKVELGIEPNKTIKRLYKEMI